MRKELVITTSSKNEFVDITKKVEVFLKETNGEDGIITIFVPHTTAAVTINENADPDVKNDMIQALNRMIPEKEKYKHLEGNSPAHIKASVLGMSEIVLVHQGSLVLGTWQGIYFCEFDGPRKRKIIMDIKSS